MMPKQTITRNSEPQHPTDKQDETNLFPKRLNPFGNSGNPSPDLIKELKEKQLTWS